MCGIFGYLNYLVEKDRKFITDTLLTGLGRLEYRGYDSAGACLSGVFCGEVWVCVVLLRRTPPPPWVIFTSWNFPSY